MLQNSWSIKLNQSPTHATIAQFPEPSIVYQGTSNQLSVFTNNKTETLPIRKQVLSLGTINNDKILILTRYNLSCFDFLNNEQKFTIEFQNAQKMEIIDEKIFVICGSSLYCYDFNGEEVYVNHISANIATLAKVQMESEKDGIVIATNDMTMTRYSGLNISFDYAKIVGTATTLCWIGKGVMVGTKQGTIAYYESKKSKWKAKSSHSVLKIVKYNQTKPNFEQSDGMKKYSNGEGDKIYVLRENGNIEHRDWTNGGTISKIKCGEDIKQGFVTDFRKEGYEQIMVILASGAVRAFNVVQSSNQEELKKTDGKKKAIIGQEAINQNQQIETYQKIKTQLMFEITKMKESLANADEGDEQDEILNPDFKMKAVLEYKQGLNLVITTTLGYISGLTFEEPIMPVLVDKTQQLKYKFRNSNESAGQIVCEVLVHSSMSSSKYLVRSLKIFLPKFWKWGLDPEVRTQIGGKLKFKMIERNARYLKWVKQCFFINLSEKQEEKIEAMSVMKMRFYNWYQNQEMEIIFYQRQGFVEISCDCLKTMGEIVQDLVNYVGLKNLNTELYFPKEKQRIKEILNTVERLSQAKVSISSDMAESINTIKFLLVKGESARQVGSMNSFRKTYGEVMEQNRNLITQIDKKNMNTKTLSQAMKSVGNFINQIANVRFGESKNRVIAKCRQAIKKKDFPIIIDIMNQGVDLADEQ